MKKTFAVFFILALALNASADNGVNFPKTANEIDIQSYLARIYSSNSDYEDIFYYLERTSKLDYVIQFVKVFNKYYKDKNYQIPSGGYWRNPINIAINENNMSLIKEIITIDTSLVSKNDKGGQFDGIEPIAYAVKGGNIELVLLLLPYVNDINSVIAVGGNHISNYSDLDVNLLSLSPSTEIDEILIKNGITQIGSNIQYPDSVIIDDNVNLRSGPGTNFSINYKVNKDTKVTIIGYTYKYFSINGISGRWINILYRDQKVWVFEPYIYIYSQ